MWLGCSRVLPFATVRREDQVQRGKLQHTLHPGHGQAAEADLRGLKHQTKGEGHLQLAGFNVIISIPYIWAG